MKLTDYLLVLVIVLLSVGVVTHYRTNATILLVQENQRINTAIDMACDSAIDALLASDEMDQGKYDRDRALTEFYNSLFASFGILANTGQQEVFRLYVPVFIVADSEGFYVNYKQEFGGASKVYHNIWSDQLPYKYEGTDDWTFYFNIENDSLRVVNTSLEYAATGSYDTIVSSIAAKGLTCPFELQDRNTFMEFRAVGINSSLETAMSYYATQHNLVASNYGIEYNFNFSTIDRSDEWNRGLSGVTVLVLFQGMPLKNSSEYYNKVNIATSYARRKSNYYTTGSPRTNDGYYHKASCALVDAGSIMYDSKEECARDGYFPCTICNP